MPDSVLMNAPSPGYYADGMAADLAGFSDALRQEINHSAAAGNRVETAYVGHSYGGATVGAAEQYGLDADRVMHVASAGMGHDIWSPDDLPASQDDVDRYAMTAPGDPISLSQGVQEYGLGHGADPDTFDGTTRLSTGNDATGEPLHGLDAHIDVLQKYSDAWENQYSAIVGQVSHANEYAAPGVGQVADMAVTDAGQTYADSISEDDSAPAAMFKAGGSLTSYGPAAGEAVQDWSADRAEDIKDGYDAVKDKLGDGAQKTGEAAKDFYDWATPW